MQSSSKTTIIIYNTGSKLEKKQYVKILTSELEVWTPAHLNASGIWASSSQHPGVPP